MPQLNKLRRPYVSPILKKGPRLGEIAAAPVKSTGKVNVCWVARAAFGPEDIRWRIFRQWLVDDAPAWFRAAYVRYGPPVGAWLESRETAKALVRRAMNPVIRRKLFR